MLSVLALLMWFGSQPVNAQQKPYLSLLRDTLFIGNGYFEARYVWNSGNICLVTLLDKRTDKEVDFLPHKTPLYLKGESAQELSADFKVIENDVEGKTTGRIELSLGQLQVRRVLTVFRNSPGLRHQFYFKGRAKSEKWLEERTGDNRMIESHEINEEHLSQLGHLVFNTIPWKFEAVSFKEATDYHDNPVAKKKMLGYRKANPIPANLIKAIREKDSSALFILKESPIGYSQQHYPGFDFLLDNNGVSIHGLGVSPEDLSDRWVQGYGYALGITSTEDFTFHKALLSYQKQIRPYTPARDFMIMANTWGDRSKDSRMNETFILEELDKAKTLGITHLQLDDGWQQGLSKNSASKAGINWDDWNQNDWVPHATRFPGGLQPIIKRAKEHDVRIGLWFNPSKKDSYAAWERDANILLSYFRDYGITTFKVDGMQLEDKTAEVNLRKFFEKVIRESGHQVTFNMDVTAGNRMGYHFFQEYGNIFLENRYTDWGNYYPYRTLRNLWQLGHYVPTERFQIEFLNVDRNAHKYSIAELAPQTVGQAYAFGVAMMAQPLAWMELTGLKNSDEDFIAMVSKYKTIAPKMHQGVILPIGNAPDGYSWTGFISITEGKEHYVAVYREQSRSNTFVFELPVRVNAASPLLGNDVKLVLRDRQFEVSFDTPWQFALIKIKEP